MDHSRSSNAAHALHDDVERRLQYAHLAHNEEANGHRRIDVAAADVTQTLQER